MSDEAWDSASNFPLFGGDVTAAGIIENVLIGHVNGHMASIKDVIGT